MNCEGLSSSWSLALVTIFVSFSDIECREFVMLVIALKENSAFLVEESSKGSSGTFRSRNRNILLIKGLADSIVLGIQVI